MNRFGKAVMAAIGGLALAMVWFASPARAEGTSVDLSITHAERYLWRGIPLNEEYVLQPSLTVGSGSVYINVWANFDMTPWGDYKGVGYGDETGNVTEIDYSGGYETLLFDDMLILGFGFATYTFQHQQEINLQATTEIYGTVGFGIPLEPTFTVWVDEGLAEGSVYAAFDIGHSFPLWESGDASVALDFSGHLGYGNDKYCETYFFDPHLDTRFTDWSAQAALPITVYKGVTLTPAYTYSSIMTDELRDIIDASPADLDKEAGIFTLTLDLSTEV